MSAQEVNELDVLFPGTTYKLTSGEEIEVKPVTFGKLKVFTDSVSSLFLKLEAAGGKNISDPSVWPLAMSIAHEEVINIMMAILKKDRKWFDEELAPIDGLHLFGMIVRQNMNESLKKKFLELGTLLRSVMPTLPSS